MLETSARLLRLLSLLQARPDWPGAALAARLGVSARTVRRDVDRLRSLGYPVQAVMGPAGGYRLGAGAALPPLLLDDDEAVAVAVGLRTAAGGSVAGIAETSLRALTKLEGVLPARLRRRVAALQAYTVPVPDTGPSVDPAVLTLLAGACRDRERLRFEYRGYAGAVQRRSVEPHRLVSWGRRWYLVAWDAGRRDWRTFRVDRLRPLLPVGPDFVPRAPPAEDLAADVSRGVAVAAWAYRARVLLHAPAAALSERLWPVYGVLEPRDERTCYLDIGAETLPALAVLIGLLDVDFEVREPPELVAYLRSLSERYRRATPGGGAPRRREPPAPRVELPDSENRKSRMTSDSKPTVVLVHGAWGDATAWDGVIRRLHADGYPVIAPANPLRGLASDAAYIASVLDTVPGPVVLVGHSYGGAVITNAATGKANVKALVYIAAFAPDEGEDTGTAIARNPGSQIVPPGLPGATTTGRPYPLPGGGVGIDVYINADRFREIFVGDVPEETAAVMAAAQRPASVALLQEKSGVPAWKSIPSWALVATGDNTIGTANVRFMAERAGAKIVEVDASHAALVSRPAEVADLIRTAAGAA